MVRYIVERVVMALITILVVAYVTFVLMMSVSGSPFNDEKITPEQRAAMEAKYGIDDPLGVQVLHYLKGVIMNQDLGVPLKMQKDRPVLDIITEKFPLLARIDVIALVWAVAVGTPLGCLAAYNRGKWAGSVLWVVCTLGVSILGSMAATFLLILFCNDGASFEFMGTNVIFDAPQGTKAYLVSCLALGLHSMCYTVRPTRSSTLDVLGQDHIKTARAKDLLIPRIVFKHVLRSGVIPVIIYLGPLTALTPAGGFVVEAVYTIPGLGRYLVQSVQNRDYFIIMGTTTFLATLVVIMNPVVDILHRVMDPRIDLTRGE